MSKFTLERNNLGTPPISGTGGSVYPEGVPAFPGIERPDQLPQLGERESPTLDFKCKLDRLDDGKVDSFELAKDVAAMASVYGGTLLVGACEEGRSGKLGVYKPLSAADATEAMDAYQLAARDRCRPVPLVSPVAIPLDQGSVVAINVMPVVEGPVAVRVRGDKSDGYGNDTYVFPVRVSTHAIMFTPEQLPMLMNPEVRRMAILLRSIPPSAKVRLHGSGTDPEAVWPTRARCGPVDRLPR